MAVDIKKDRTDPYIHEIGSFVLENSINTLRYLKIN